MQKFLILLQNIYKESPTYKNIRMNVPSHFFLKFVVFLVGALTTYFSTYLMIQIQELIDIVTYQDLGSVEAYMSKLMFIIAFILMYLMCMFSDSLCMFFLELNVQKNTLHYLFSSYYKQNFVFAKNTDSGEVASKFMNDAEDITSWLAIGSLSFWKYVVNFIIIYVAVYQYHPGIAFFIVFSVLFCFLLTRSINETIAHYNKLEFAVISALNQFFIQANKSFMDVKQLGKEDLYITKLIDMLENQLFKYKKIGLYWELLYQAVYTVVLYLIPIGILLFGIYMTLKGNLTIGTVIAIYTLSSKLQAPLSSLAGNLSQRRSTMVLSERLDDFIVKEDQLPKGEIQLNEFKKLEFNSQKFVYPNDSIELLKDVNFDINTNEIVCIKGKSGIGKSTISSLIMQFYKLTDGSIKINDINIEDYDVKSFYSNVNILSQNSFVFQQTIKNNITIGDEFDEELYKEVIDTVQLNDVIEKYTDELMLDEDAANISGGQKQRIALARLLIRKPKLLILDEPTSALDDSTALSLITSLKKYIDKYNMSILVITHSSAFDDVATKVVEIK